MINFESDQGNIHDHDCKLCKIDMGELEVYALGSTKNQRILLGLSENPLIINKNHGETSGRREMLYVADQIQPVVHRVYVRRGASGIMLASNYQDAADVKDHPHTHLEPIVRNGKERQDLPLEVRGNVLVVVRELKEGIAEILSLG